MHVSRVGLVFTTNKWEDVFIPVHGSSVPTVYSVIYQLGVIPVATGLKIELLKGLNISL